MPADIIPFPVLRPPAMCGKVADASPFHVWPDEAEVGDPCRCGAQQLPSTALPFLRAEADEVTL